MKARDIKRVFWPATSPSMNLLGWSARYGHPIHDVESLISRFGARPTAESVRNAERKVRDVLDVKF